MAHGIAITRPGDVTDAPAASLHERILAVAAAAPTADALVCATGRTSYGELAQQVRAIAAALTVAGISPGDTVGVVGNACAEQIPAVLGVLAAGATHLPVPAALPAAAAVSTMRRGAARMALVCGDVPPRWLPALTVSEALRIGAAEPGFTVAVPASTHPAAILPATFLDHAGLLAAVAAPLGGPAPVIPTLDSAESLRDVFGALLAGSPVAVADAIPGAAFDDHPLTFLPPADTAVAI